MRDAPPDGGASRTTEPAAGSSSGTDVSLRDYIDALHRASDNMLKSRVTALEDVTKQRFELNDKALTAALSAAEKAVDKALNAAKEAVDKAETAASKRFDSTNEFRSQLQDQANTFMPREVAEAEHASMLLQIQTLTARIDVTSGRSSGAAATIGYFVAAGTLVISIIVLIVNAALR